MTVAILIGFCSSPLIAAETNAVSSEKITRHEYSNPQTGRITPYLLYHPDAEANAQSSSLLIFLYGAGGSLKSYNYSREPYQKLRSELLLENDLAHSDEVMRSVQVRSRSNCSRQTVFGYPAFQKWIQTR
ncbi:hypothetical protein [Gimesia sp.]|uniref:hypothetical protein n=1 Tax=Gimesia sp. TaxID=2024833 RepID=UPI003A8D1878